MLQLHVTYVLHTCQNCVTNIIHLCFTYVIVNIKFSESRKGTRSNGRGRGANYQKTLKC